jgi:hypothetical protein
MPLVQGIALEINTLEYREKHPLKPGGKLSIQRDFENNF